jgi:hypothetical protein
MMTKKSATLILVLLLTAAFLGGPGWAADQSEARIEAPAATATCTVYPPADFNDDCKVDARDLIILMEEWQVSTTTR